MTRFILTAACAALFAFGCGGSNLVPTGGAESTEEGAFLPQADTTGTVARVDNAGRLLLTDGRRVALAGIDLSSGADVCADEGLSYLRRLTVGGTVVVDACDASTADALSGMVVATTEEARAFVNVEMLRAGFAQIGGETLEGCGGEAAQARLDQAQSEAQAEGRGNFGTGPSACRLPPPTPEPVAGPGATPRTAPSPSPMPSPVPGASPLPIATPAPLVSPLPVVSPLPGPSPIGGGTTGMADAVR